MTELVSGSVKRYWQLPALGELRHIGRPVADPNANAIEPLGRQRPFVTLELLPVLPVPVARNPGSPRGAAVAASSRIPAAVLVAGEPHATLTPPTFTVSAIDVDLTRLLGASVKSRARKARSAGGLCVSAVKAFQHLAGRSEARKQRASVVSTSRSPELEKTMSCCSTWTASPSRRSQRNSAASWTVGRPRIRCAIRCARSRSPARRR